MMEEPRTMLTRQGGGGRDCSGCCFFVHFPSSSPQKCVVICRVVLLHAVWSLAVYCHEDGLVLVAVRVHFS